MQQSHAFDLFRRVRAELDAARFATTQILADWDQNFNLFNNAKRAGVTDSELRRCAENLEITFVLRLFSEYEAVLRDFWKNGVGKRTRPDMQPLMESIGRRRRMNNDDLASAHEIREYRNEIIHENPRSPRFHFSECSRALGKYLRWLPQDW
jgi:hypothetical protein